MKQSDIKHIKISLPQIVKHLLPNPTSLTPNSPQNSVIKLSINPHIPTQPHQHTNSESKIKAQVYAQIQKYVDEAYRWGVDKGREVYVVRMDWKRLYIVGSQRLYRVIVCFNQIQIVNDNSNNTNITTSKYNSNKQNTPTNPPQQPPPTSPNPTHPHLHHAPQKKPNKHTKMSKLQNLSKLHQFCQQNNINTKQIIKLLLIQSINIESKVVIYRTQMQILEIIEEILRALVWQEVTVGAGGDVLWVEVDVEDDGYKGSMDNKDQQCQNAYKYKQQVDKLLNLLNYKPTQPPITHPHSNKYHKLHYSLHSQQLQLQYANHKYPQKLLKMISTYQISQIFTEYYDRKVNGVLIGELMMGIKGCAIVRAVCRYVGGLIRDKRGSQAVDAVMPYFKGICAYGQYKKAIGLYYGSILNYYLKPFVTQHAYIQTKHTKTINKYLSAYNISLSYTSQMKTHRIKRLQSTIRTYFSTQSQARTLQQQYLAKHEQIYRELKKQYTKVTQTINNLIHEREKNGYGHITNGIVCNVNVVHIGSWNCCGIVEPGILQGFFRKLIEGGNYGIVKIWVQGMSVGVIRADGKMFRIGIIQSQNQKYKSNSAGNHKHNNKIADRHPKIPKQQQKSIKNSDDNSYKLMKDKNGQLYAKGQSLYGQLGIGQTGQNPTNSSTLQKWTKVSIKQKIKHFDCRAKKSICLTVDNTIYIWGAYNQQINLHTPESVNKPLYLSHELVISVSCSYTGYYILTDKAQIYQITIQQSQQKQPTKHTQPTPSPKNKYKFNWIFIKKAFKGNQLKNYQEKTMITSGNSSLEIMYVVGLKINCYDSVRKRNIVRWFQDVCQDGGSCVGAMEGEEEEEGMDHCLLGCEEQEGQQQDLGQCLKKYNVTNVSTN